VCSSTADRASLWLAFEKSGPTRRYTTSLLPRLIPALWGMGNRTSSNAEAKKRVQGLLRRLRRKAQPCDHALAYSIQSVAGENNQVTVVLFHLHPCSSVTDRNPDKMRGLRSAALM
jgi:hypothetical protein